MLEVPPRQTSWQLGLRLAFAISYGPIIALTYVLLKALGGRTPALLLCISGLVASLILTLAAPHDVLRALKDRTILVRSVCFAVAQLLLVFSFGTSTVSASLTAAMIGTVTAFAAHQIITNAHARFNLFAVGIVTTGTWFILQETQVSLLALTAGLLQGTAFFLLKKIATSSIGVIPAQVPGLLVTGLIGLPLLTVDHSDLGVTAVSLSAGLIILSQAYAFWANRIFSGATATIIAGSRIPCSIVLDGFLLGSPIKLSFTAGALLVLVGFVLETKLSKSGSSR